MSAGISARACVCVSAPPSFPSKSYTDAAPPSGSSFRLASPCDSINRSIYIAFHGWALPQYFRGPLVNWPLIIHRSLVHHILDASMHVHRPIWKHNQRLRFVVWQSFSWSLGVGGYNKKTFLFLLQSVKVRDRENWCIHTYVYKFCVRPTSWH